MAGPLSPSSVRMATDAFVEASRRQEVARRRVMLASESLDAAKLAARHAVEDYDKAMRDLHASIAAEAERTGGEG